MHRRIFQPRGWETAVFGVSTIRLNNQNIVGNTVTMSGVQAVHYDDALGDGGLISDFRVVSWFEDIR
jgi:hypothetical protein